MDENLKKKIILVRGLIQKKEYKQALDELQVLMYKYQKSYQVHLMSGLCYEKLQRVQEAEKCFKQVVELKQDEPNAIKALCQIYTKRNDIKNATVYLQKNVEILKKGDDNKYREAVVKLVEIYRKDEELQKIVNIFMEYCQKENQIGEDFVQIADAYFHVSIKCKSFNLQKFELMGLKGEQTRPLNIRGREKLNNLLIEIVDYLKAVSKEYKLSQRDIANSLYEMKYHFPQAPAMLMLMLLEQYCVAHVQFSTIILPEIYKLLCAYYKKEQENSYLNLQFTEPQIFTVSMVLAYEYLAFFQEFFTLDPSLQEFIEKLASQQQTLLHTFKIREDYNRKINNFILKNCRYLSKASQSQNLQDEIEKMKRRIQELDNSFLQEVIAKIGMNCFVNYQKLNDMKNMLKTRIKNLSQGDMVPHLYKYYFDYLIKIAKIYKILDEQINVYDVIDYINKYDTTDVRYTIEGYWLAFSKSMLLQTREQQLSIANTQINNLSAMLQQTNGTLRSDTLRKIAVIKIFAGQFDVQQYMKQALLLDRSFGNLQTIGVYHFHNKQYQQSLTYLKQAFILNQTHYHTNRLIFLILFKLDLHNEAIDFAERIKEGFRPVFWVNYVLALKCINLKKYQQGEQYLNSAIEAFTAGCQHKYKFSYQKTQEHEQFAFLYMIQQNKITILFDEIILPQNVIFEHLPMASSLHFTRETKKTQIKLFSQMAEVLKILGRTKSALNYLSDAFLISEQLTQEEKSIPGQSFQICILHKQYATLLFYMQMFRESQIIMVSAYNLCKQQIKGQTNAKKLLLLENVESEIDSLSFQVAVQRLSIMSKFQSHQTVEEYLNHFNIQSPKRPSPNFYKGKYQFFILEYLHRRNDITKIESSILQFLKHFNLSLEIKSTAFQNKFLELDSDKKLMVKQALEDYFVIKYIWAPQKIESQEIMTLIQLFPRSTIFYIIFGMSTKDIKMKTASFLKCIQLDKQSPISIDLLASLYLKQKNYLCAAKLFLKSLEMNILSAKCYLGLSICLFCIIGNSIAGGDPDVITVVHKALVRINSYMEYLRTVDPSQNYHLLKFLKLLVNDEPIGNFEIKTILQTSKRNARYKYKDTLIYELLEQATREWREHNIWQHEGQLRILQGFLSKFVEKDTNLLRQSTLSIAYALLRSMKQEVSMIIESSNSRRCQFMMKQVQRILSELCIWVNLLIKSGEYVEELFQQALRICKSIQGRYGLMVKYSEQNIALIKKLKSYLFEYCIINKQYEGKKREIKAVFPQVLCYEYLINHAGLIPSIEKELFREVLLNPESEELKGILSTYMVLKGKKIIKGRYNYKIQLINNTHDNLTAKKQTLKKLFLLYRDQTAIIAYIQICWSEPNSRTKPNMQTYLALLTKLQSSLLKDTKLSQAESGDNSESTVSHALRQQLQTLKVQIYSYYLCIYGQTQKLNQINVIVSSQQMIKIEVMKGIARFYQNPSAGKLKQIKPLLINAINSDKQAQCFALLQLLSFITNRYQFSEKIYTLLGRLTQIQIQINTNQPQVWKAHLLLLNFLYLIHQPIKTEEELIGQILQMEAIISKCQQYSVSQNTLTILKCSKCLFSADYQNLALQLSHAANNKIVTYSDQLLINFFEIMRLYKQVEVNPNKQGVIEEFAIYIEQMILLVKDPFYQGFFISLKAIVNSIIVPDEPLMHDRNLKLALLLSPHGTKPFVKTQQHLQS